MIDTQPGSGLARIVSRLEAVLIVLHIVYWMVVGCALIMIPWFHFWDHNHLLYRFPGLQPVVSSPFTKGAVLGLGIVNLVIGSKEIANLRRSPKNLLSR
jgi:hypothetical protein